MEKLDLTRQYKAYYSAKTKPELVSIEPARFLSITGKGDPSNPAFAERIQAIYTVAYSIKFSHKQQERDFVVAKLEGQWWYDEEKYNSVSAEGAPQQVPRSEWEYRLLIRMPEYVTTRDVEQAIQAALLKKKPELVTQVELFELNEGQCVQMLHIGPFATEPETLAHIMAFITERQLARNGLHHEIYLSAFRKTPPHKLKTILREPVK